MAAERRSEHGPCAMPRLGLWSFCGSATNPDINLNFNIAKLRAVNLLFANCSQLFAAHDSTRRNWHSIGPAAVVTDDRRPPVRFLKSKKALQYS